MYPYCVNSVYYYHQKCLCCENCYFHMHNAGEPLYIDVHLQHLVKHSLSNLLIPLVCHFITHSNVHLSSTTSNVAFNINLHHDV